MEKQTERTELWIQGGAGEEGSQRVRCMERVTWKLTLLYVKQIVNGNLLYVSGNSNGLCINLEGWDGVGDGREVQKGGDICTPMADSC